MQISGFKKTRKKLNVKVNPINFQPKLHQVPSVP